MFLPNVSPQAFNLSAVAVGAILIQELTPNEQNAIGNWLMLVSQYLCTSAAYGQLLQSQNQTPGSFSENNFQANNQNNTSNGNNDETIAMLTKMVNAMNKEIENIKRSL